MITNESLLVAKYFLDHKSRPRKSKADQTGNAESKADKDEESNQTKKKP